MTKDEMMLLTIKQLSEYFALHPECFALEEQDLLSLSYKNFSHSTLVFQSSTDIISNPRTVAVTYNDMNGSLVCNIYFRNILPGTNLSSMKPDASVTVHLKWKWFNKTYKIFRSLRAAIIRRKREQESNEFLSKLHSVFPGTFDDYIFGKPK